jgi:hypothetical protein
MRRLADIKTADVKTNLFWCEKVPASHVIEANWQKELTPIGPTSKKNRDSSFHHANRTRAERKDLNSGSFP